MSISKTEETDLFFKRIIDLVPAITFFDTKSNLKLTNHARLSAANSNDNSQFSSGKIVKKVKFDPNTIKSTSELQEVLETLPSDSELESADEKVSSSSDSEEEQQDVDDESDDGLKKNRTKTKKKKVKLNGLDSGTEISDNSDHELSKGKAQRWYDENKQSGLKKGMNSKKCSNNGSTDNSDRENGKDSALTVLDTPSPVELRKRLRARIEELRAIRKATPEQYLEKRKLRRKQSKLDLKIKRRESQTIAKKGNKMKEEKVNGVKKVKHEEVNAKEDIVFSKFEFLNSAKKKEARNKPKSYKELYEKAIREKKKIEKLKETDVDKAKEVVEKKAWKKALDLSEGVKVKDNPELIKKSMKREAKQRKSSAKKWKERTDQVAEQQQKRQEKRRKHIQYRKQQKIDKKIKTAKKKGRIVSGF